jgi:hypothetical protein
MNPLGQLRTVGQSPWYDYIQRSLIASGDLKAMIDQRGLRRRVAAGSCSGDECQRRL